MQASREDTTERQGLTVMSDPFMFLKLPLKCFERTDFTFPRVNPSDPARITRRRLPLWKQLQSHIIVSTTVYVFFFIPASMQNRIFARFSNGNEIKTAFSRLYCFRGDSCPGKHLRVVLIHPKLLVFHKINRYLSMTM